MKKVLVLLLILTAGYFGLKRWSPATLDKIVRLIPDGKGRVVTSEPQPALPAPEPVPAPQPVAEAPASESAREPAREPARESARKIAAVDKSAQVIVLLYHRIEGTAGGSVSIAPELFEQHMQRLKDRGIAVISMQDFLAWRRNEKSIPAKSALITIDDGYVSAFETARPILKKFGYPWTYFIYTKFIGSGGKSISWEQLGTLRDEGVEIGCHTASHISLRDPRGKPAEVYNVWLHDEIAGAKRIIENRLGIRCAVFAYPDGQWSTPVIDAVKAAGFDASFTAYGQRITHGANAEKIGRYAWSTRRPQDMEQAFNFNGPISVSEEPPPPAAAEPAAAMLLTQPMNGDSTSEPSPLLKANLATLGAFDDSTLTMRLSGTGPVEFKYDAATRTIESRPRQPLKPGEYTVVITAQSAGKKVETKWSFHVVPAKALNATLIGR